MAIDLLFLLAWGVLPLIWHYLLKVAHLRLAVFSIPTLLILFIYLFQYIGIPILYFQLDDYRAYFVTEKARVLQVFFFTSITITLLILGFIAARINHGKLSWSIDKISLQIELNRKKQRYSIISIVLLIVGCSVLFLYFTKIGYDNIAILSLFNETELSSHQLRSKMGNDFDGKYHWYQFGKRDILVFLSLSLFSCLLLKGNRLVKILLTLTLLATTFSLILATEKAPFVVFVLMLFFCRALILDDKVILSGRKIIKIVLSVLSIQIIFYMNFMDSSSVISAISSASSRILTGQLQPAYHYLEIFPTHIGFLWGQSFPNPGGWLPFENFRLTVEVMHYVNARLDSSGIVGSMPTIFWGEAYANFGVMGVFIVPLFIGYFIYYLNILLYQLQPNPLSIALFIYTAEYISRLSGTGFSNYLVSLPLFLMMTVSFIALFFVNNGKIKITTKRSRYAQPAHLPH